MGDLEDVAETLAGLCCALTIVTHEHAIAQEHARRRNDPDWEAFIGPNLGQFTLVKTQTWMETGAFR